MTLVPVASLWLPILLAAVLVFLTSAIVWMALPHHKSDYRGLPDEAATREALKPQSLGPGQYNIPHVADWKELKTDPQVAQRFAEGPVGFLTVVPNGVPRMGRMLLQSLVYYLVVSATVAYVASRTLAPGTEYLKVFQVTGTVAWVSYGMAVVQDAIWFGRPWSSAWKVLGDALLYGLMTAGVFGWLWPG